MLGLTGLPCSTESHSWAQLWLWQSLLLTLSSAPCCPPDDRGPGQNPWTLLFHFPSQNDFTGFLNTTGCQQLPKLDLQLNPAPDFKVSWTTASQSDFPLISLLLLDFPIPVKGTFNLPFLRSQTLKSSWLLLSYSTSHLSTDPLGVTCKLGVQNPTTSQSPWFEPLSPCSWITAVAF